VIVEFADGVLFAPSEGTDTKKVVGREDDVVFKVTGVRGWLS
jgi:hypothetical protein